MADEKERIIKIEDLLLKGDADRSLLAAQVHTIQRQIAAVEAARHERLVLDQWMETQIRDLNGKLRTIQEAIEKQTKG